MNEPKLMSSPRQVDIAITGKCNLACKYCFYADEMVARSDLPTDRWLAFFGELGKLGVMTVCLTGGEAFTRLDLFELIDGIISNRMRYKILSNGTMITEKTLAQFEIGKRRQRLESIQISVDGASADVQDLSRPKSFTRAIRALKILKAAGYPLTVRVTVNRYNVNDLENVARMLLEEVGIQSFGTNEAFTCGATDRSEESIILSKSQRKEAMITLTRLAKQYNDRISAQAGPLVMARELAMIDEMLDRGETSMQGRSKLCGCGGVFNTIAVMHDGTIVPCNILSSLHLGEICSANLQDIWINHPIMKALRERSNIPLSSLVTCQSCRYQGYCTGGCPAGALSANGSLNTRDPRSCYRVLKDEDPFIRLEETVTNIVSEGKNVSE